VIEKILSRLERIDHKEYSCAFEFADSSTFDEMCRCFEERKILAKEIENLNNTIDKLEKGVSEAIKQLELLKYIDKYRFTYNREFQKAIDKLQELKGSDKE